MFMKRGKLEVLFSNLLTALLLVFVRFVFAGMSTLCLGVAFSYLLWAAILGIFALVAAFRIRFAHSLSPPLSGLV
jgi:hypothetical protein